MKAFYYGCWPFDDDINSYMLTKEGRHVTHQLDGIDKIQNKAFYDKIEPRRKYDVIVAVLYGRTRSDTIYVAMNAKEQYFRLHDSKEEVEEAYVNLPKIVYEKMGNEWKFLTSKERHDDHKEVVK